MSRTQATTQSRTYDELLSLASMLAEADERMLYSLIQARKAAGLKQRDVAELLGIKQSSVAAFERYDNDPRLSTIRRYALAVGAQVEHRVTCPPWDGDWISVPPTRVGVAVMDAGSPAPMDAPADSKRTDFAMAA